MICNFMGYITEKYDFTSYSGVQTEAMPGWPDPYSRGFGLSAFAFTYTENGGFLKWGYPKSSSYWGNTIYGNPLIDTQSHDS
jgi:hypothetical protein